MWSINSDLSDLWQQGYKRKKRAKYKLKQKQGAVRDKDEARSKGLCVASKKGIPDACRSPSMCGESTSFFLHSPNARCHMPDAGGEARRCKEKNTNYAYAMSAKDSRGPFKKRSPAHTRRDMWGDELHNCISCCQMLLMFFTLFFSPVYPALLLVAALLHICSACCPICWPRRKDPERM